MVPIGKLTITPTRFCITCENAVNQYLVPYTEPTDEPHCAVVSNVVTGQMARCVEIRAPGVAAGRCGEAGALYVAREAEVM
jgi:hypothetical protein